MPRFSIEVLGRLQELIYGQSSLRFSPSRLVNLEVRLEERLRTRGLDSYEEYFRLLQEDLEEFDALIDAITTKETYFFRLPEQFKALAKEVMPEIEARLAQQANRLIVSEGGPGPWALPLRIWSAGATGEEAYSIAMAAKSGLNYPRAWKIEILASDISKAAVTAASLGFYESNVLDKIPEVYRKKCVKAINGGGVVADELLDLISFRVFNLRGLEKLVRGPVPFAKIGGGADHIDLVERFDVIFCRNVMIYFDFPAQQRLVDDLSACLKPGGYLFTGDAELLHIYRHDFILRETKGTCYYQKPDRQRDLKKVNQYV